MHRLYGFGLALAAWVAACTGALAQDTAKYPEQMVRLVVPFSAGSMTDLLARTVAEKLSERWKQQVIVENRPGLAGTSSVAKATPDGYTLMLTSNGHTVIGSLNKNLSFDPIKDFVGVSQVATTPLILVAPPESSTHSLKDLIDAAKARPGALNYGSAGLGSTTGIAAELLKQTTGTDIVHVPFRGLPESQTAVIRGDVAMAFTFFNVGGDLVQSGKMRGLAVTGAKRLAGLPNPADLQGGGRAGFPIRRLVRHPGTGRHAEGHRRQGQSRTSPRCWRQPTSRRASSRRASTRVLHPRQVRRRDPKRRRALRQARQAGKLRLGVRPSTRDPSWFTVAAGGSDPMTRFITMGAAQLGPIERTKFAVRPRLALRAAGMTGGVSGHQATSA